MDGYDIVWSGALECAGRAVATQRDPDVDKPRDGRGWRPPGQRFRDGVLEILKPDKGKWLTCGDVCDLLNTTTQREMEAIARALAHLVKEGRAARQLESVGPGRCRWLYWRL